MRILIAAATLLISQLSFGQSYLGYYQQINQARLHTLDSSYRESAELYKKTFDEYDFEFARDCIHAVEVAAVLNRDTLTNYFVKVAIKRGIPLSYFAGKPQLQQFRQSTYWPLIVDSASTFAREYQSGLNQEIRDEVNVLFTEDQHIRERYYRWWNFPLRPFIGRKWKVLNQQQVLRMIEITKTHGFPGESLIGIDLPRHHYKIDSSQFSAGMPIILFVHHYSKPNVSFDSLLLEQVLLGNLNNEHFATICDFEAEFGNNSSGAFGYYGLRHKPRNYVQDAFAEKRSAIGLLSDSEIRRLNKTRLLSRYWNRLK